MEPVHPSRYIGESKVLILVYVGFYALTVLSRYVQPLSYVVYFIGIAIPMVFAKLTGEWASIGVTRHNMRKALFWGALTGAALILLGLILFVSLGIYNPPIMLSRQLLIGIPVSFLVIGPFQELLFRGWMQPRLQRTLGGVWGLLLCSALFALWDALPPLKGFSASAIIQTYFQLIPSSFCVAVVFGYIFHRTGNILAPWIAHSLGVVGLIISGRLAFVG